MLKINTNRFKDPFTFKINKLNFIDLTCLAYPDAYNDKQISLNWSDRHIVLPSSDKITLPGYELLSITTDRKSLEYGGPGEYKENQPRVLNYFFFFLFQELRPVGLCIL